MIKNSNIFSFALLLCLSIGLVSCQFFGKEEGEGAVARVGDKYLYPEDIDGLSNAKFEDSASVVNAYIDNWVKEQLLLRKALQNLPDDQVNFEEQLENYRRSLIIYAYENQLLRQKLDTFVTEDQVEVYYQNNKQNFELREDILQLRMVLVRNSAPNQDSLRLRLFSRDSLEILNLVDYCTGFAEKCVLDTSQWISWSTLVNYLPDEVPPFQNWSFGRNELKDSLNTAYIDLFDKKRRGDIAPVNYVTEQIKAIIKNQRRLKLLADVRKQIFEDASLKNVYEVYN